MTAFFRTHVIALTAALALAVPAVADDFTDSVAAALKAYEAGDIKTAKEEIDFAAQVLAQMKAEGLKAFLSDLVWIEHVVHALMRVVDRIFVLNFGRKIDEGAPEAVMNSAAVQEIYMGIEA